MASLNWDWNQVADLRAHRQAAAELLEHYGVDTAQTGEALLEEVASVFANLPYENVTKLIRKYRRPPGEARMRLPGTVVREHLEKGAGGTCFSLGCLFGCALERLSMRCYPVFARMRSERTHHCGLVVPLGKEKYLLDPGYLVNRPVRLVPRGVSETQTQTAQITLKGSGTNVESRLDRASGVQPAGKGMTNGTLLGPDGSVVGCNTNGREVFYDLSTDGKWRYRFWDKPLTSQRFVELWQDSFDWVMMNGIHLSRSIEGGYMYVNGHRLRCTQNGQKHNENIRRRQKEALFEYFRLDPVLTAEALALLAKSENGRR